MVCGCQSGTTMDNYSDIPGEGGLRCSIIAMARFGGAVWGNLSPYCWLEIAGVLLKGSIG